MLTLSKKILEQARKHVEGAYPNEACGLLIGKEKTVTEWIPCQNIYDKMHNRDPKTYPRNAKTAYLIDPKDQKRIFDETEKKGLEVLAIVHSHTDHDAYFSDEDKLVAAPWGEPMYPDISYIVISVWDGKYREANEFYWDKQQQIFSRRNL